MKRINWVLIVLVLIGFVIGRFIGTYFDGTFLHYGQTFGLSIPASVGKKAHKRGMPCISAQNALSYTYDNSPEKGIEI